LAAQAERKRNMSWPHPDLYLFLCLLAGFATFLAIVYECIQKFRRKPPVVKPSSSNEKAVDPPSPRKYLENVKPLDGLQREPPARTEERANKRPSDFGQLCENVEALPPKEQASRVVEYFGILGGARPAERRDRKGKRRRLTPGEVQRLEQRSHTRL
jgi:hypothetical protein